MEYPLPIVTEHKTFFRNKVTDRDRTAGRMADGIAVRPSAVYFAVVYFTWTLLIAPLKVNGAPS